MDGLELAIVILISVAFFGCVLGNVIIIWKKRYKPCCEDIPCYSVETEPESEQTMDCSQPQPPAPIPYRYPAATIWNPFAGTTTDPWDEEPIRPSAPPAESEWALLPYYDGPPSAASLSTMPPPSYYEVVVGKM
ncbi:uncharacterized protein LOC110465420 [Mizuhopecten yessoensis]|uniref:uncharacterized protein LOC110465420 n=1 Tax=Mizuhopecten yessoensis TaxID=6573 RepID=UPI000B45E345|nr:uncharacterized protein LOC110465420 [Mizuhopecten yessoensis]